MCKHGLEIIAVGHFEVGNIFFYIFSTICMLSKLVEMSLSINRTQKTFILQLLEANTVFNIKIDENIRQLTILFNFYFNILLPKYNFEYVTYVYLLIFVSYISLIVFFFYSQIIIIRRLTQFLYRTYFKCPESFCYVLIVYPLLLQNCFYF